MPDNAAPYNGALDWNVVRRVLAAKRSILRIVRSGRMVLDAVELPFSEVKKYYENGNTLLLRYAERSDDRLARISKEFGDLFQSDVDIQAYCTPAGGQAFTWHYDVEEVFILQTKGSKKYKLRANTVHPNPLLNSIPEDLGYEKERSPLCAEVTLQAGDWLYIPSGWWHIAQTLEESMHLSVGVMPQSNLRIFEFLKDYLVQLPHWRLRLPWYLKFTDPEAERNYYESLFQNLAQEVGLHMRDGRCAEQFVNYLHREPVTPRPDEISSPGDSPLTPLDPLDTSPRMRSLEPDKM